MKRSKWMLAGALLAAAMPGWAQILPRVDCATWDYGHFGPHPLFFNLWSTGESAGSSLQGYAQYGYYTLNSTTVAAGGFNTYTYGDLDSVKPPTSFPAGTHLNVFGGPFTPTPGSNNGWVLNNIDVVPDKSLPPCPAMESGGTPLPHQFPPLGLANGQTIRINVLANRAGSCAGTLSFTDSSLFNAIGPTPKSVNLASGQAASLDFVGAAPVVAPGQRKQVVPRFIDSSGQYKACQASVEVFTSSTGVTVASSKWIQPVYQYDFNMQGLSTGQTMRINVSSPMTRGNAEQGCGPVLSFTDSTGAALGPTLVQGTGSGGAQFLDLPSTVVPGLTGWAGGRVQVRPILNTGAPSIPFSGALGEYSNGVLFTGTCLASVEIFDTLSGLTRVVSIPEAVR